MIDTDVPLNGVGLNIQSAQRRAAELGLPPEATWREINAYQNTRAATQYIIEHSLALPIDSDWATILGYQTTHSAMIRAAELGLPEDSTWSDINHFQNSQK